MNQNMNYKKIIKTLILIIYFSFCSCESTETRSIPKTFSLMHFDEIIDYSLMNYYDPSIINTKKAYINAAVVALKSLPYGLILYPEKYYQEIEKYVKQERIIPGKPFKINEGDPYIILEPDYKVLNEKQKKKEELLKYKELPRKERIKLSTTLQEELKNEQQILEKFWDETPFERYDFLSILSFIESNLEKYSVYPEGIEGKATEDQSDFGMNVVYFYATNGFLSSLDPHSGIIDLKSWEKMRRESEDSSFEGIGAILRGGGMEEVVVETPLPGSPAVKAGIKAGDIILKVNGESIENLNLSDVVKRIRGPKDTYVELEIHRPSEMKILNIKIKRGVIEQKSISSIYIPESQYSDFIPLKIGIIKLTSFLFDRKTPSDLIREEFNQLMQKANGKLDGLIIDLRNNPGGDLDEAIRVSGLFLQENSVVVQIQGSRKNFEKRRNPVKPMLDPRKIPVMVLINANSASASEIFASALMDYNIALILGETSFGKATVQGLRRISNVILKLTTARYYAPRGYTIQVYGVEPDIKISEEFDGSFVTRFREVDMWKHLPELEKRQPDPVRETWVNKVQKASESYIAKAEEYLKLHQDDAIKPDVVLIRAIAYFKGLKEYPAPTNLKF